MTDVGQAEMFEMPRQPRSRREARDVHEAAVALRKAGYTVRRGGRKVCIVNGERMPEARMMALAMLNGWPGWPGA